WGTSADCFWPLIWRFVMRASFLVWGEFERSQIRTQHTNPLPHLLNAGDSLSDCASVAAPRIRIKNAFSAYAICAISYLFDSALSEYQQQPISGLGSRRLDAKSPRKQRLQ
ncbi:MAG: hypothetical protein RR100_19095, partial [Comamonas sp.]